MGNENSTKQDCECGSGCCEPKKGKSKLWTKIVFIVIVIAAAAIVTVKLVKDNSDKAQVRNDTISSRQTAGCYDSTSSTKCVKVCDPSQSGCCPQAKK